jgi:hypothetical protein
MERGHPSKDSGGRQRLSDLGPAVERRLVGTEQQKRGDNEPRGHQCDTEYRSGENDEDSPPGDYRTAYLWEEIWAPDTWMDLLKRFLHVDIVDAGTVVGERYELVMRLGESGYGEVWKGFDTRKHQRAITGK